jgi:hypothetical protein
MTHTIALEKNIENIDIEIVGEDCFRIPETAVKLASEIGNIDKSRLKAYLQEKKKLLEKIESTTTFKLKK